MKFPSRFNGFYNLTSSSLLGVHNICVTCGGKEKYGKIRLCSDRGAVHKPLFPDRITLPGTEELLNKNTITLNDLTESTLRVLITPFTFMKAIGVSNFTWLMPTCNVHDNPFRISVFSVIISSTHDWYIKALREHAMPYEWYCRSRIISRLTQKTIEVCSGAYLLMFNGTCAFGEKELSFIGHTLYVARAPATSIQREGYKRSSFAVLHSKQIQRLLPFDAIESIWGP